MHQSKADKEMNVQIYKFLQIVTRPERVQYERCRWLMITWQYAVRSRGRNNN